MSVLCIAITIANRSLQFRRKGIKYTFNCNCCKFADEDTEELTQAIRISLLPRTTKKPNIHHVLKHFII